MSSATPSIPARLRSILGVGAILVLAGVGVALLAIPQPAESAGEIRPVQSAVDRQTIDDGVDAVDGEGVQASVHGSQQTLRAEISTAAQRRPTDPGDPSADARPADGEAPQGFEREVREVLEHLAAADPGSAGELLDALTPLMARAIAENPLVARRAMRGWYRAAETTLFAVSPGARKTANESAAIATLRNLASSQAQLQASGAIDVDGDGAGEYGYFAELSGGGHLRGTSVNLNPPVLSAAFRKVAGGRVARSGYHFAIYLPSALGAGTPEQHEGGAPYDIQLDAAADHCEVIWCAYAWPIERGTSGTRAFFINQMGDVFACKNEVASGGSGYSGDVGPQPDAAFAPEAGWSLITSKIAVNAVGKDGERWIVVQ